MAQITVVFKDFEEMKTFARVLLGEEKSETGSAVPVRVPIAPAQPQPVLTQPNPTSTPQQATVLVTPAQLTPTQQPVQPAPVQQPVQTTVQTYTLDDLARAGMTLMDSGRQADLQGLLKTFGVEALPALPKEQYGAFATALREMGAQI